MLNSERCPFCNSEIKSLKAIDATQVKKEIC